jgi:hypothetical protein
MGLGENLFKRRVVSGFLKELESPDTTVQDMIGEISGGKAWTARHAGAYGEDVAVVSRKDSRPLFCTHAKVSVKSGPPQRDPLFWYIVPFCT